MWGSVSADRPLDRTDPLVGVQVISALLAEIRADETGKLQSLGVVFGDVLAELTASTWVEVVDAYGRDAGLRFGGPDDVVFPLTMISKRVEAGEPVEVFELLSGTASAVLEARQRIAAR